MYFNRLWGVYFLRTARAGDPSAPLIFNGRQINSYGDINQFYDTIAFRIGILSIAGFPEVILFAQVYAGHYWDNKRFV
jgi:hypothetical protein